MQKWNCLSLAKNHSRVSWNITPPIISHIHDGVCACGEGVIKSVGWFRNDPGKIKMKPMFICLPLPSHLFLKEPPVPIFYSILFFNNFGDTTGAGWRNNGTEGVENHRGGGVAILYISPFILHPHSFHSPLCPIPSPPSPKKSIAKKLRIL